nr:hypothetical protein [uncultured Arsenicibacter sp.]
MESLDKEQTKELIAMWEKTACYLCRFQTTHWNEFSFEQHLDVNAYQNSLLTRAYDLQNRPAPPTFRQADHLLAIVRTATCRGLTVFDKTNDLSVCLSSGAILVALAAYVSRADSEGIQVVIRELDNVLAQVNA